MAAPPPAQPPRDGLSRPGSAGASVPGPRSGLSRPGSAGASVPGPRAGLSRPGSAGASVPGPLAGLSRPGSAGASVPEPLAGLSRPGSAGASVPGPRRAQVLQQRSLLPQDSDPVRRSKLLMPQLKESLQNVLKAAAQSLGQNANEDHGQEGSEGGLRRFDKSLEEFYALCDQLELCLRLAYACLSQSRHSAKHSPTPVPTATKPDSGQAESLPYSRYLSMIQAQIGCARDLHDALLECAHQVTGKLPAGRAVSGAARGGPGWPSNEVKGSSDK